MQSIERLDAGLLQSKRAGFNRVIKRNARFRQSKAFFNPPPPQGKRVATVLQVLNGRTNQLGLACFNQRQHEAERKRFKPDAGLPLVVERTIQNAVVQVKKHGLLRVD